MLDTLAQIRSAIQSDLNVTSNSSLYPPDTIDDAINRAYVNKAARLFRWPALEDALMTSTAVNQAYYDLPTNWSPDSMWRLEISSLLYGEEPDGSPMDYHDFLTWKINNPNSGQRKWAVQWLRFFVHPVPTAVITNAICIWGQKVAPVLSTDDSETIFTGNMPECNEAILLEAEAILKRKGELEQSGQFVSAEAKQILAVAFGKIKQEQSKYEKIEPMFHVPDYFSTRTGKSQVVGNFNG